MTPTEDLLTMIARLYELAEFYAPPFVKPDLNSCYADILELVGAVDDAATRIAYQDGQLGLFEAEGWPI